MLRHDTSLTSVFSTADDDMQEMVDDYMTAQSPQIGLATEAQEILAFSEQRYRDARLENDPKWKGKDDYSIKLINEAKRKPLLTKEEVIEKLLNRHAPSYHS